MPYALTLNGTGFAGAPAGQDGALRFTSFSPSRWTGGITLAGNASIRFSGSAAIRGGVNLGSNTLTFLGAVNEVGIVETTAIAGTGNVIYDASSTTVRVDSTYTGTTTLQSGTTFISTPNSLGASLGTAANRATVNTGAELYLNNAAFTVTNKLLTLNGGSLVANGSTKGWTGAIDLTANSTLGAEGINGVLNLTGGVSLAANTATFRVNFNDSIINVNTTGISGTGAVVVTSPTTPGAVNFNVTNTYTGGTTVNSGRLFVNATSGTGSGAVVVTGTGTLRGTGSITGTVNIQSGGRLAPGGIAGPGTLTINNSVALASGATFAVRVNGSAAFDVLRVTAGSVTLGNSTLSVDASAFAGGTGPFTILDATGANVTGEFVGLPDGATFTANGQQFQIDYTTNTVVLTPVPVPAGALWCLLGLACFGRHRHNANA
jgi:autotransporter-associated beta strand protein